MTNKPCGSVQQSLQWGISNSLSGNVLHSVVLVSSRLFQNVVINQTRNFAATTDCTSIFQNPLFANHARHRDDSSQLAIHMHCCCAHTVQFLMCHVKDLCVASPQFNCPKPENCCKKCQCSSTTLHLAQRKLTEPVAFPKTVSPVQDRVANCKH